MIDLLTLKKLSDEYVIKYINQIRVEFLLQHLEHVEVDLKDNVGFLRHNGLENAADFAESLNKYTYQFSEKFSFGRYDSMNGNLLVHWISEVLFPKMDRVKNNVYQVPLKFLDEEMPHVAHYLKIHYYECMKRTGEVCFDEVDFVITLKDTEIQIFVP